MWIFHGITKYPQICVANHSDQAPSLLHGKFFSFCENCQYLCNGPGLFIIIGSCGMVHKFLRDLGMTITDLEIWVVKVVVQEMLHSYSQMETNSLFDCVAKIWLFTFLAHLSTKCSSELLWSFNVRRPSSVVRPCVRPCVRASVRQQFL